MDCGICSNPFDEGDHRPKLLHPCCHSFCLQCLLEIESISQDRIKCPSCKQQVSQRAPRLFTDNFSVLSILKTSLSLQTKDRLCRYWCVDCASESSPACESDGHDTRGLLGYRRSQAKHQLNALKQQETALAATQQLQKEALATLQPSAAQCSQQLLAVQDCAAGLWEGREPWEQQLERAGEILQDSDELNKDLQLLVSEDPVSVRSGPWIASRLDPAEHPELRVALLQLRRQGKLQQLEDTHTQDLPLVHVELPHKADQDKLPSKIQVMSNLYCDADAALCLKLLEQHAPHLQEVQLWDAGLEHLQAVTRMPCLRKLEVLQCHPDVRRKALPEAWEGPGLLQLRVRLFYLPMATVRALIRPNRHSLQELWLSVGTAGAEGQEEDWHTNCSDLPAFLLEVCGVEQLRWLSLHRDLRAHSPEACRSQLSALREALPGCSVSCQSCWRSVESSCCGVKP